MKQLFRLFVGIISFGLITFMVACGGGGGGGGGVDPAIANLQGTWLGTLEDPSGAFFKLKVTIDGAGKMTQVQINDVDQNDTATITKDADKIFSLVFDDGTEAGFMVDASSSHAGFVDEDFNFGVLQKGATGLPVYDMEAESIGSFSGYTALLNATGDLVQSFNSQATVSNTHIITGSDDRGVTFSGSFVGGDDDYGVVYGSMTDSNGFSATVEAFLSVDKNFAAVWACDLSGGFPEDCAFNIWTRQ